MNGVVANPFDLISPALSFDTLRRLLSAFGDLAVAARQEARAASTLRAVIAATGRAQDYEQAQARCRAVLARKKRQTGWHRPHPRPVNRLHPNPSVAGNRPPAHTTGRDGRPPAEGPAVNGKDAGVAGALPPPAMGHGRPAFPGAGRAASVGASPGGQRADSVNSAPHPANPSFCSENEGISPNFQKQGDIHYAQ